MSHYTYLYIILFSAFYIANIAAVILSENPHIFENPFPANHSACSPTSPPTAIHLQVPGRCSIVTTLTSHSLKEYLSTYYASVLDA
jgi:predicted cobalt transporter CbtA